MVRSDVIIVWLFILGLVTSQDGSPVVSTASGKVRGTVQYTNDLPDKPVYTFLGIPYAAPPVGDLRFRAPEPVTPWEGVMDATKPGPFCPQPVDLQHTIPFRLFQTATSEDCLTLNVETPSTNADGGLPVLVWIHGGSLETGGGYLLPFAPLAAHQDVVVVSFNYRLGLLGFLSTRDENAPGNFGFLDQVLAIRWVKENIQNFGGDPDRITIFGESAGGYSVSYHVVSPLSRGLFRRAISQSGVFGTNPVQLNPLRTTKVQAEELGCDGEDTSALVNCLRERPVEQLYAGYDLFQNSLFGSNLKPFGPVVDGYFLTSTPEYLLKKRQVSPVDYLMGVNDHEYGFILPRASHLPNFGKGMTHELCTALLKLGLPEYIDYKGSGQAILAAIEEKYRDQANPDDIMAIQYQYSQMMGDLMFVAPTVRAADGHTAAGGKVYLYENHYMPSFLRAARPAWVGCDHTDDWWMVVGAPFTDIQLTSGDNITFAAADKQMSLKMMEMWANFARTGNPTDQTSPEWPVYTTDHPAYMNLDLAPSVGVGLKSDRVTFWNKVIPELARIGDRDEL
ncbi:Carboxylesterase 5A [Branchiostoma belcheri]|nr:Carboxylesterase 5A [Branchiostoma belcheri]